jgi:cytoskeleton protein RodZ
MTESTEAVALPADSGPGQMLAQLRGERNLSVSDVAQRLKYGARQIEALEAEEFDKLPGATFVRGMVRGYAKLLETDPQPLLKELARRYVPGEISVDLRAKRIPFPEGGKRGTRVYLILSVLVVAAVLGVLYEWRVGILPWATFATSSSPPKPQKSASAPAMVATPAVAPVKPSAGVNVAETPAPLAAKDAVAAPSEGRIRLEFDSDSWVEIRGRDGQTLMSQLNPAGSRRTVVGQPPLSLVIGNAAAVRLTYNDSPVDLKSYVQIEVARLTLK